MQKRWKILAADEIKTDALQASLKINRTICRILVQRGIEDFESARNFSAPSSPDYTAHG